MVALAGLLTPNRSKNAAKFLSIVVSSSTGNIAVTELGNLCPISFVDRENSLSNFSIHALNTLLTPNISERMISDQIELAGSCEKK
jgi:hypothetical protein